MKFTVLLALLSSSVFAQEITQQNQIEGCRQQIMNRSIKKNLNKSFSPIQGNDRAEDLLDHPEQMIRDLKMMDEKKLVAAEVKMKPWSDSYWPLYKGGIAYRYMDYSLSMLEWKEAYRYVYQNPAENLAKEGEWDKLSPSEKYDLLLELKDLPLTSSSWSEGKEYMDRFGRVETWMGLCHGWSAASIMMKEPRKNVEIDSLYGKATFHPSDIKALATAIWAKGQFNTRFIGGRCNSKKPRNRESDCLDNNPGTWHLAIVNQVGALNRSFVMDVNPTYEVWNHPVISYQYSYINPKTKEEGSELEKSFVQRGEWRDPKEKFRARETKYIVGIRMLVAYALENEPSVMENQELSSTEKEFVYDLELNERFEIIGGEWSSGDHPDFIWAPVTNSFPQTYGGVSENINLSKPSAEMKKMAMINAKQGIPWGPVVKELVKKSSEL
ncbi:MAG: hypothetical protein AB7I27_13450 [Bacteriovoracaceae bacterium]